MSNHCLEWNKWVSNKNSGSIQSFTLSHVHQIAESWTSFRGLYLTLPDLTFKTDHSISYMTYTTETIWMIRIAVSWRGCKGSNTPPHLKISSCRETAGKITSSYLSKMQNLGWKPILEELKSKLKYWAPMMSSVRNLQRSVGALQLPASPRPIWLTHDRAGFIVWCWLLTVVVSWQWRKDAEWTTSARHPPPKQSCYCSLTATSCAINKPSKFRR